MGGIACDISGRVTDGVWAAGEVACMSLHGANRLGTNSTAECLVWGAITGQEAARWAQTERAMPDAPVKEADAEQARLARLLDARGPENQYEIRGRLRQMMDEKVGVFRTAQGLEEATAELRVLRDRSARIHLDDRSWVYNTDLVSALELENLLDIAEVVVAGAMARTESRGAHARRDFPNRDDEHWLAHTRAFHTPSGPRLEYTPVTVSTWKPVERKY
jgi:succinate dehydrogenase / fumarate reductase flavoprotein subunit